MSKADILASLRAELYKRRRRAHPEHSPASDFDAVLEDTSGFEKKTSAELRELWQEAEKGGE